MAQGVDHKKIYLAQSEAEFQDKVIQAAQAMGWIVAHFRPVEDKKGVWRTAVAADGKGFPDLVLVHPTKGVIFAELKSELGQLFAEQKVWRDKLMKAKARYYCWRPSDWNAVEMILRGI